VCRSRQRKTQTHQLIAWLLLRAIQKHAGEYVLASMLLQVSTDDHLTFVISCLDCAILWLCYAAFLIMMINRENIFLLRLIKNPVKIQLHEVIHS